MINIALIKYPVTNLGPGNRICIWTSGCKKKCLGCMSEASQKFSEETLRPFEDIRLELENIIFKNKVDGVTISGGEPFDQNELEKLVFYLKEKNIDDILIYTGYKIEELEKYDRILANISVLIDGPYIDELNDNRPLRGSSNQRIIILNSKYRYKYLEYLKLPRTFDVKFYKDRFIIIGLLNKGALEIIHSSKNK